MNHSFFPSQLNPTQCRACKRGILDHSKHATCEACNKVGPCEIFMTILMCDDCQAKEKLLQEDSKANAENRVIEHNERINQEISSYAGFFNARVTPIVQVKEIYDIQGKSFAEFHATIKEQLEQFARVLFEQNITTTEDTISKLLIEFRAEIRTKLKEGDINYQPPIKAPKVSTTKVVGKKASPLEKMAEAIVAKAASQGKVMTIAEAIRKLQLELGMVK